MESNLINYIIILEEEVTRMNNSLRDDERFLSDTTRIRYLHQIGCKSDVIKNLKQMLT